MSKQVLESKNAPKPIGPYVQAVAANGMVFCSGQIPVDPATGALVTDSVAAATERVLLNLQAVLAEAGLGLSHVVKTTVFLANMQDFVEMNDTYERFFGDAPPARACVEVARLPKDVPVEIECIACQEG